MSQVHKIDGDFIITSRTSSWVAGLKLCHSLMDEELLKMASLIAKALLQPSYTLLVLNPSVSVSSGANVGGGRRIMTDETVPSD